MADTKVSPFTGNPYPAEDPVRGRATVYGWIQGRALEAMAGHILHFRHAAEQGDEEAEDLADQLEVLLDRLAARVTDARARNRGHLFFFLTPEGDPFRFEEANARVPVSLSADSPSNFSDLFAAKGLLAAAHALGDSRMALQAKRWLGLIADDIFRFRFVSDQQTLDPKNPQQLVSGRRAQAPFMILTGGAALWMELEDSPEALRIGTDCLERVFGNHVNLENRIAELPEFSFFEYVDERDQPYVSDGPVICDPGHAVEFTGLALRFLQQASRRGRRSSALERFEAVLPSVLSTSFRLGYNSQAQGLCKAVDLLSGRKLNKDMPWWSLPEGMRAALLAHAIAPEGVRKADCLEIFARCHNGMLQYVRPEAGLLLLQTRSGEGEPLDVIPATSDLDPGYHTGLSLLDCLNALRSWEL